MADRYSEQNFTDIIKNSNRHKEQITAFIGTSTEVRQGCPLPPLLFLFAENRRYENHVASQLGDMDFTNNIALRHSHNCDEECSGRHRKRKEIKFYSLNAPHEANFKGFSK